MFSFKKIKIFIVLLLLIFSIIPAIPIVSADPIEGTDGKINVLYIGYAGFPTIHITADMYDHMYYKDDFKLYTIDVSNYQNDLDDYDLTTFDIVVVDMAIYSLFGDFDAFEAAHNAGVTLVAVMNNGASTPVPDYFDFRDTAALTTSSAYPTETVEIFFAMFEDAASYSEPDPAGYKQFQEDYAENMLMFLAEARNKKMGEESDISDIIDKWEQNKIKFVYIGYTGQEKWSLVNQYSSFMNVTYLPSPWTDQKSIEDFGNNGGFKTPEFVLAYMIMGTNYDSIDANITADENKLGTIAAAGNVRMYSVMSYMMPPYVTEIDDDYKETRADGAQNAQILVFAAQKYEQDTKDAGSRITTNWILKQSGLPYGLYHPDLPDKYYETLADYLTDYAKDDPINKTYNYDSNNLTVGIWFHKAYNGNIEIIDDLIHDLESKGVNVIAGFDIFADTYSGNPMLKYFAKDGTKDTILIGSAISIKGFALSYYDYDAGIEWLEELDVTVQKAVIASSGASSKGIPNDMLVYETIAPNRDGMTDFIILGNTENGPTTYHEQKDWLANRAIKYAILKQKPNADKNIAIMYYNYPPGKDNIGANYLNVMRSLGGDENGVGGILREMKKEGYTVSFDKLPIDENELTEDTLLNLVLSQGINVGSYAPGVLDKLVKERGNTPDDDWWGATLLPVETYKIWFDDIENETIKQTLIREWGEPWNYSKSLDKTQSGMMYVDEHGKRFFVIPAVRFGNVWLTPQPDRALATEKAASYHGGDLPPTHQYVAYYLWLNNMFEADAIVSFGTHGTHEWLPGAPYGLNVNDDLAPLLLKDIPNIYLYIVANVGEGLTAEYRGNALIIDHMTPPMIRSNLDSNADLSYLESEIQAYLIGQAGSDVNKDRQEKIVDRMFDAGIQNIIGIDHLKRILNPGSPQTVTEKQVKDYLKELDHADFSKYLREELYNYIEAVKENNLPYGMHVYGQSMSEEKIASMLRSMWGPPFDQVLYETYYKGNGYAGIPYEDDQMINDLVTALEAAGSPGAMMTLLNNAFDYEKYEINGARPTDTDHGKIVRFILGPVMDIQGDDADAVILEWKSNGVFEELKAEIIFAYYFYTDEPSDAQIEAVMKRMVQYCINERNNNFRAIDSGLVNEALIDEFKTQTYQNQAVVAYMTGYGRLEYADRLRECGPLEMKSLLSALSGGYIPPSAGNDPIQNRDAVPTGRNFYGIDPAKFPTKSAWDVGKSLADQLLADYYAKYGEFPNTVAFSRFGTEFIRDEGALEACALYLLGTEPVWDTNGNVDPKMVKVIPLSELTLTLKDGTVINRPRIDIVYASAGMRDSFGDKLKLLNVAVKTVSNLDEPPEWNYVRVNTEALRQNPATAPFAEMRCFANEPGNYEIGTGNMISASGSWDNPADVANMYLNKMGYVYGDDDYWGVSARALLEALLKKTDATVHAASSNLYDSLDNDDFFQYFGALNLAVKNARPDGRLPEMYVADTRTVGQSARDNAGKVYSMKQYMSIDMESRYKNEAWISGMMESGYAGSGMFSDFVDNLFGWAVTSDGQLVSFSDWSDVFDIYVSDKYDLGLADYFSNNPYAYQSITGRMLESIRKEYMVATTDEQRSQLSLMEQKLVNDYVQSVIDYGVVCCDHTCGNPRFDTFMKGQMSVLGIDPEKEQQYWAQVTGATYRGEPQSGTTPTSGGAAGGGYGMAAGIAGPGGDGESGASEGAGYDSSGSPGSGRPGDVFGYEMTESYGSVKGSMGSIRDFLGNPSFSSSNAFVLLGIIGLCAAVFYGFKKKNI